MFALSCLHFTGDGKLVLIRPAQSGSDKFCKSYRGSNVTMTQSVDEKAGAQYVQESVLKALILIVDVFVLRRSSLNLH